MIRQSGLLAASLVLALGMSAPVAAQQSGGGGGAGMSSGGAGSASGGGTGTSGSSKSGGGSATTGGSGGTSGSKRLTAADCNRSYSSSMGMSRAEFDRQCQQYRSKK